MALPVPRAARIALGLARLCALVVCAVGALVLASWYFDLSAFDPLFPDLHSMAPNAGALTTPNASSQVMSAPCSRRRLIS